MASKEIEGDLLEKYETMTAEQVSAYARSIGIQPPTDDSNWRLGKLVTTGRSRGGEETSMYQLLIWSAPDFPFTRDLDRDHAAELAWPDDPWGQ